MFCFKKKKDRGPETTPDQVLDVIEIQSKTIKRIAFIPGHTAKKPGMRTYNELTEFHFNQRIIDKLYHSPGNGGIFHFRRQDIPYQKAMKALARQCQEARIDLAIELHINAAGIPEARGCETLIKHGADRTAQLSSVIIEKFSQEFDIQRRREYKGIKGIKALKPGDRGSSFVYEMEKRGIMGIVFEPFFGDYRTDDSSQFLDDPEKGIDKMVTFWKRVLKMI